MHIIDGEGLDRDKLARDALERERTEGEKAELHRLGAEVLDIVAKDVAGPGGNRQFDGVIRGYGHKRSLAADKVVELISAELRRSAGLHEGRARAARDYAAMARLTGLRAEPRAAVDETTPVELGDDPAQDALGRGVEDDALSWRDSPHFARQFGDTGTLF